MKIQNLKKNKIKHNKSSSAFFGGSRPAGILATNTGAPIYGNGSSNEH